MIIVLGIILVLAVVFGPGLWARWMLARHGDPRPDFPGTGGELARHLLDEGGLSEIRVEITTDDGEHRIIVSDNGQGVAEQDRERIFEAFQTGSGPARSRDRSSGIGLAIVKKIAEAHGGRAWVESDRHPGARLHVAFPSV